MKIIDFLNKDFTFNKSSNKLSQLEKELLISHTLKISREEVLTHPEQQLSDSQIRSIDKFIERRLNFEPIAYILGYKEFYGLKFEVNSSTLIPRPETENLVEEALKYIKNSNSDTIRILEVGTGTGCIPISILNALEREKLNKIINIIAIDISKEALKVAKRNADNLLNSQTNSRLQAPNSSYPAPRLPTHGHGISHPAPRTSHLLFLEKDILAPELQKELDKEKFDLIISNPPYIKTKEIARLMPDVKDFEPHLALDGGVDGEKFYRAIKNIRADKYIFEGMNGEINIY